MPSSSVLPLRLLVLLPAGLLLMAGCGGSASLKTGPQPAADAALLSPADTATAAVEPPACVRVADLIDAASVAARDGDAALAHRLAQSAARLVESEPGLADDEGAQADYYGRIGRVYLEALPPAYADSAPEAIAMYVFQGRMLRTYDSIARGLSDSAVQRVLSCQAATRYDVPMVYNERVLAALLMFRDARKDQMDGWLGRAARYLPLVRGQLADSGLPADLAYLPLIESGFNPRAYSVAHAAGIWQFIPSTGERYGLRRTYWLDERRDPQRSTAAAIAYLKKLMADFGHWHLALAAYNCGENGLQRTVNGTGSRDFWNLPLPQQTRDYVPKYLAALIVARNPACFGFAPLDTQALAADTVRVSDCLDLGRIAQAVGSNLLTLEELNPHLLRWCTPPDAQNVTLYLPPGSRPAFDRWAATLTPQDKVKWQRYRIEPGDNLIAIARRFNTSLPALRSVNRLSGNRIVAGEDLFIPVPPEAAAGSGAAGAAEPAPAGAIRYLVKYGETLSEIAATLGVSVAKLCRWNSMADERSVKSGTLLLVYLPAKAAAALAAPEPVRRDPPAGAQRRAYVVQAGDNVSTVSRALGVGFADLLAWNGRDAADAVIRPGDTLVYFLSRQPASAATPRPGPVPASSRDTMVYAVASGDNLSRIAGLFGTTVDVLASVNGLQRNEPIKPGALLKVPTKSAPKTTAQPGRERTILYQVKKGDNIWSIAQLFNMPMERLCGLNGLSAASRIRAGDTLKIVVKEDL